MVYINKVISTLHKHYLYRVRIHFDVKNFDKNTNKDQLDDILKVVLENLDTDSLKDATVEKSG